MKTLRGFCLLLLLCCLSGAELQDTDMIDQRQDNTEVASAADLRNISAKLTQLQTEVKTLNQLQVKMEQLQTLNQEQNAKLQELQNVTQEQASKLQELQNVNQEQKTKLQELQNVNQEQASKLQELQNVNQEQNAKLSKNEVGIQVLQNFNQVKQVAFSASLRASGAGYTGPFSDHFTLIFKHVVSNIGNAYNSHTGVFTAPVRGVYHFVFYIHVGGGTGSKVGLMKNGQMIFITEETQSGGWGTAGNAVTLLLETRDVVFLRLQEDYRIYDNDSHYSTFSGHLLFRM